MDIKRSGSRRSGKGPAEWFTGTVRIDPLFVHLFPERREAGLSFVVVCDSQNASKSVWMFARTGATSATIRNFIYEHFADRLAEMLALGVTAIGGKADMG